MALHAREELDRLMIDEVLGCIIRQHNLGFVFQNVKQMQEKIQEELEVEIKTPKLIKLLHQDLNARYKKIKKVSFQGNSD